MSLIGETREELKLGAQQGTPALDELKANMSERITEIANNSTMTAGHAKQNGSS